ncbi:MAG: hypothetical protein ABL893_15910 [Hyphomicrobium sp.]
MQVDADTLIKVLQFAFTLGATFFAWSQARNKAGAEALKELEKHIEVVRSDVHALSNRCGKIEGEMRHMPDKDMVHTIELGMKDMQTQIAAQGEVLKGYAAALSRHTETMQRLEEFLLHSQRGSPQPAARRK